MFHAPTLRKFVIAMLLTASFLVFPTVDAFLCAGEVETVTVMASSDSGHEASHRSTREMDRCTDDGVDHGQDDDCGHGHCHHAQAHALPRQIAFSHRLPLKHDLPMADALLPHHPDRIARPPRA